MLCKNTSPCDLGQGGSMWQYCRQSDSRQHSPESHARKACIGMHHDKPIEAVRVGVGRLGQVGCGWRGVMDLSSV